MSNQEIPPALALALEAITDDNVVARIWRHDHSVWKSDPAEITEPNRLGWLTVIDSMIDQAPELARFAAGVAAEGYETAVVLGMGGSSLAPEVFQRTFGSAPDRLSLEVLDTTDPGTILDLRQRLNLGKTLFIVSSKSGTTQETLSQFSYFWEQIPDGVHFVAVTDSGTPLETLGREREFRKVFANPADIGGRYSALSFFGLVPASLVGVDLEVLLKNARAVAEACRTNPPSENPGALLGAFLGQTAAVGRDKLTLVLPEELSSLGDWIEQLIAESTGKEGKGIVPIAGETLGSPEVYGADRAFVALGEHPGLDAIENFGHPVLRLPFENRMQLGGEFFRWEFATAIAAHVLKINPFDQPDVQAAKDATARILSEGPKPASGKPTSIESVLATLEKGDYLGLLAYLPPKTEIEAPLELLRLKIRQRYGVATSLGFGPRYLHSTGQLHKGGPGTGAFIQIIEDAAADLAIPGQPHSFDQLRQAQALGDFESLTDRGRRVARINLGGNLLAGIDRLLEAIQ